MARTVLLADDSVTAQNMGRRILMDAGYEVVTVNNGSAALKKIHESHPDLIVLDVYMPGYGGLEVCQRLKEAAETARIPVLLSVGKMEPFKAEEAKRVRADGHIVKPFEASELLAALTRMEDKIVPQGGGRRGKSDNGKSGKKTWRAEDHLASADEASTDRVAYLTEKKRRVENNASSEAAEVKQEPAVVASPLPTESTPEIAAVETPTAEIPAAAAGDSLEWVLGKSLFGKPVSSELALGESIFDKTVAGKAAADAAAEANVVAETKVEQTVVAAGKTETVAAAASGPRWVAENAVLTAEEASLALDAEMQRAQAKPAPAEPESSVYDQPTSSHPIVAHAQEAGTASGEAAFAAAASAGGATDLSCQHSAFAVPAHATTPAEAVTAEVPMAASDAEPMPPSEATLAWKNWQHIRDSVMSPKKAEAIAESVAQIAQAQVEASVAERQPIAQEDSATKQEPSPSATASVAPEQGDSSINEIVDSVLADLKPRLMQEIARKLAAKK